MDNVMSTLEKDSDKSTEANAAATPYRDVQWVDKARASSKKRLSLQKLEAESMSQYLTRIGTRGMLRDPDIGKTTLDVVLEKVALPLGSLTYDAGLKLSAVKARALNNGYRKCPCTDVKRLTNSFKADPIRNMTLAELQESARAKKPCARCWLISEGIDQFADNWKGISPREVLVSGAADLVLGSGSIAIFTVFWVDLAMRKLNWEAPKWSKLELEMYFEEGEIFIRSPPIRPELIRREGGQQLYPKMQPRKQFLSNVDADDCVRIVSTWISTCRSNHIFCNSTAAKPFVPTRLIDIGSLDEDGPRLIDGHRISQSDAHYATLSYSWGPAANRIHPIPLTLTTNIKDRSTLISWTEFTPVAQDAIRFTQALGLRYVWIDSLCIVQDDPNDFAVQASQMASIYGEAYIVIAATRSFSSDAGLFQTRTEPIPINYVDSAGKSSRIYVRKQIEHEDFLTSEARQFTDSPLFSRAWCFQERLLARRVVHFGPHELLFECKERLDCECGMMVNGNGIYNNFKISSAYGLVKLSAKDRYRTWYSVLKPYTSRLLTFESDRLPALSGFARLISIPDMGGYFAGLWQNELPGGLLWRIIRALPGQDGRIGRPDPYRAPTWSWAGIQAVIEGHVQFHAGIEPVAQVRHIECKPSTADPFGAVESACLVLEAPVVKTTISDGRNGSECSERSYSIFRDEKASNQIHFEADLAINPIDTATLCIAVEHDTVGIHQGRWSCLVLQKDGSHDHYHRIGTIECPADWLEGAKTEIVHIQ